MPVTNVKSGWVSGNLVFTGKDTTSYFLFDTSLRFKQGTSTADRVSFTNAVDVWQMFTKCMATTGICTGLDFEHAAGYQGSTALQFTGIRGVLRVLSGCTHTSGYNDAAAGYLLMEGTINGDGHYYGVRGVVLNGGTWTACTEVAAGCFEYNNSATVSSGRTACLLLKNNSTVTCTDLMYVYNGSNGFTYLFDIYSATAPVSVGDATSGKACTHGLTIMVGSTVLHIPCYAN